MAAITLKLLLVLFLVALLGVLIGLSAMSLRNARKQRQAYAAYQAQLKGLVKEKSALSENNADLTQSLDAEKAKVKHSSASFSRLETQQQTLKAHSNLQQQRAERLTTELQASEAKTIKLQRDFASFKANKLKEMRMLKISSDNWLEEEELPVLSKRVDAVAQSSGASVSSHDVVESFNYRDQLVGNQRDNSTSTTDQAPSKEPKADLDLTQPIIASELNIPSLAESELPFSLDELELELEGQDELS